MSNLRTIEKMNLEKFFDMGGGYVCDFNDRTFQEFMLEATGVDVYKDGYDSNGTSKANRLRNFWKIESNFLVAKQIAELLDYWRNIKLSSEEGLLESEGHLYQTGLTVIERLKHASPIEDPSRIRANSEEEDFNLLAGLIRESLSKNNPSSDLDRLHTFLIKYIRTLCKKHNILYTKETPLHTLFGGYIKFIKSQNIIESEMSMRILKTSISIFEAFNLVRNDQSFAHDNPILNSEEAVLIVNNISNTIRFLEGVEKSITGIENKKEKESALISLDDVPF
ncbi:MAG: abortive infection family protein [Candidatus Moranbacteria bacterium]|nr:abortive infection family protein [Candidatus Moranbacteria bacterium]